MSDKNQRLQINDLRNGRNGVDPPQSISDKHCQEALNVHWFNATFGRKRAGVAAVTLTGSPFTGTISSMFRHVPTTDETVAELWATDDAATPHIGRLVGGTVWASPTLKDAPTGNGWDFSYASFNGVLYIAYQSAVNRLHCWDPVLNLVRRTGLAVMAVPTVADTGGATYAAVLRYYRTRATEQRAGITVRRSEYSTSVAFTPSGGGAAARVTQGTVPNESETHWEVEASLDNITFYRIATVAIGTTTYDDSALTTTYASNPLSATTGTYTLQRSYRYLAVDQGRALGFGAYTTTDPQNRVEFSAVLGSSDIGDGERVPTGNYQGLDENDSGPATALLGPVNGSFFAGKYRQFWKLTPSGNPTTPYNVLALSKVIGPLNQFCATVGEDETGNAAIYFNSFRGPYRWGLRGIEYIGKVMEDRTIGANGGVSFNLAATHVVAHTKWYADLRQVVFWWAVTADNDPTEGGIFSVGRTAPIFGGDNGEPSRWSRFTGGMGTARCSVLFSNTIGASMSRDLKPYIGSTTAANTFGKTYTGTQDLGVNYQAYIDTKEYSPWGNDYSGDVTAGQIIAAAQAGVTITVTTIADFGMQSRPDTVSLTAAGTESRVQPRVGGAMTVGNVQSVHFRVGDSAEANTTWQIDELNVTHTKGAPVAA